MPEITKTQAALFAELIYNEIVSTDPSRWSDYEDVAATFATLATDGLLTAALGDFPPLARSIAQKEMDRRNADLESLMNGLSWDERARVDNGKPLAPATNDKGQDCWNVWVTGDDNSPYTFHDAGVATSFADRKTSEGRRVFTDFSGDSGDSGELFNNSCS